MLYGYTKAYAHSVITDVIRLLETTSIAAVTGLGWMEWHSRLASAVRVRDTWRRYPAIEGRV